MKDKKKVSDILKEYKSLYDSGVIDEKEYEEKKATLLKELEEESSKDEVKEDTSSPKATNSNIFVIGICIASLLIAGVAIYSTVSYFANKENKSETLAKDEIKFGSYPQERIRESDALTKALFKVVDGEPTDAEHPNGWESYKFYDYVSHIDEETHKTVSEVKESDYFFYKDFKYNGSMYRANYCLRYRNSSAFQPTESIIAKDAGNIYYAYNIYYFKYKPIIWRKLGVNNGYTYLMSSKILDYEDYEPRTLDLNHPEAKKPNNYAVSKIRNWLNNDFFNTAFSDANVAKMELMEVDNSLDSTMDTENKFVCENTNDYVTLLSKKDFFNPNYNISSEDRRSLKTTDYAYSLTYSKGRECYWLRSPASEAVTGNGEGLQATIANYATDATSTLPTYNTYIGVVPVISVKL